ncbi:glycosyltransferase family 9 protein [Candidatus Marinarcus aquaticus]|uniref:Heptosyltransferase n=1 Tax=Candidatus Marinarcus aquaticus TaxID=2044504 RepID=A0A4Q0XQJ7_9BACT|nr:glycosyltransferase family 9 protein [Candidatus Marinarcus aquaticus]RXJ55313.1 heptosyltransferase [Candidatus Marinarcus aquaticus]
MNLLITRHDKIGDFVVTLPLFKAIKEQYPQTKLTALVSKVNFEFAQNIDFIDDVILFDKNNLAQTKELIKSKEFDASISAYIDTAVGKLLFGSRIKKRVAPATKIAQLFFNKRVKQRRSQVKKREWEYNLDLGLKLFPNLQLTFTKPLLNFVEEKTNRVVFHPGFGGSSDGNLRLDDYIALARSVDKTTYEVVFTFGPDDGASKEYIQNRIDFEAKLLDSKMSLVEFTKYLSASALFVSTSTGPMHLAGAVNTKTLSFFGDSLFASAKRWGTVSEESNQNNFMIPQNYSKELYGEIESCLKKVLDAK